MRQRFSMVRRRLRARWDYTNYVYGSEWKYLIGLLGIVLGFVVSALDPVPGIIVGAAGAVITLLLLAVDTDDLRQRWVSTRVTRNPDEANTYPFRTAPAGEAARDSVVSGGEFVRFPFVSGKVRDASSAQADERCELVWLDRDVNEALQRRAGDVRIVANAAPYRLPPDLKQVASIALWKSNSDPAKRNERRVRPLWFNGRLARLAAEPTAERIAAGAALPMELVTYFDGEASNEIWHWTGEESVADNGRRLPLAYVADVHHHVFSLERSRVANIVGVSLLAITSDDRVVFVAQSQRNSIAPGAFAASSSGSLDWHDVTRHTGRVPLMHRWRASVRRAGSWRSPDEGAPSLREVVMAGMLRELREEALVEPGEVAGETFRVSGYFRWLSRAAKPEFCGIVRLNVTAEVLASRRVGGAEALFTSGTTSIPALELWEQARAPGPMSTAIAYEGLCARLAASNDLDPADVRLSTSTFATWWCAIDAVRREPDVFGGAAGPEE
ncbi:MAG: hypothetical protein ACTH31_05750 [Pseudoclavibacter sp.]